MYSISGNILMKSEKHTTLFCKVFNLCLLGQIAWYNHHATERNVEET